jgi:hypothetical protein
VAGTVTMIVVLPAFSVSAAGAAGAASPFELGVKAICVRMPDT